MLAGLGSGGGGGGSGGGGLEIVVVGGDLLLFAGLDDGVDDEGSDAVAALRRQVRRVDRRTTPLVAAARTGERTVARTRFRTPCVLIQRTNRSNEKNDKMIDRLKKRKPYLSR